MVVFLGVCFVAGVVVQYNFQVVEKAQSAFQSIKDKFSSK